MRETAFPVLNAEMKAQKLSCRKLLAKTNLKYSTMIVKFKEGKRVTVDEGVEIRKALRTELTVEDLFGEKRISS